MLKINKDQKLNKKLFLKTIEEKATRTGFGDAVWELGKSNEDIVVLTADLTDSTKSRKFADEYPKRFFQVGVAEQNMAGIAAGLGLSGKIPFMTSYGVFSPGRNWDQIRVSICYSNANVKIVSSHTGLSASHDGATHQALEDISLTRVLPNLTVISPADYIEAKKATIAASKHKGPVYIRLNREKTPIITTEETKFELGKANVLTEGRDVTIIATGPSVYEALKAADKLKNDISCEIINCHTIKPLDEKTILESVKKTKKVVTVEEHQMAGGLGSAICELLAQKLPVPVKIVAVNDTFTESGEYFELKNKYGVDFNHVVNAVKSLCSKTSK